jgi:carboxyl-terminal processing protease
MNYEQAVTKARRRAYPRESRKQLKAWATAGHFGVLLDLRGAGGMHLQDVDEIAGLYIEPGTPLFSLQDRRGRILEQHRAYGPESNETRRLNLTILVDGTTAGAAEVLAAVLQHQPDVRLIGNPTAGDFMYREMMPVSADHVLYIATRRIVLEQERSVEAGIEPDVRVGRDTPMWKGGQDPDPVMEEKPLSDRMQRNMAVMKHAGNDGWIGRAVDVLLAWKALSRQEREAPASAGAEAKP